MDENARQVMRACTAGSLDGTMSFPEVVARLVEIGCEQYHADFRRQEKTYYMPGGETHIEAMRIASRPIAQRFVADEVVAALRAIQEREIGYVAFLDRIIEAGCIGYFVYIAGKRAIYLGRSEDFHVEHFPAATAAIST